MKSGVVLSTLLHGAVLTWGLWSLSAPEPLQMAPVESLPVDLVPIEEFSQSMIGAREAPVTETPSPDPTETPETLPMPAENVGDNETDLATPPTPIQRPVPTEQAAAASPAEPPAPEPAPEPEPEPAPEPAPPEPEPEPEPDPTPVEQPAEVAPPQPDPVEQAIAEAEAAPEPEPTPQNVPVPAMKPRPPAPRVAEPTPVEPRTPEPTRQAETSTPEESQFDADQIAALLNKEKSAGGGARRSEQQASLGTDRQTGGKLSQSELDALRGQIQRCWSPPSGVSEAGSLRISIQMRLDPTGNLEARPEIIGGGGGSMIERVAGEAALRAVQRCAPYNLPAEKYDTWADVVVNFDPSQMF
ncbi:hypothetical protein VQ042_07245 [Aurantimonas sp. A2-1-M11]|uniref:hypothetical protein n=1 Tax=Aurantimonas sp. A2-1-M11 TaxID=3113712 RepID=UPI002F92D16B